MNISRISLRFLILALFSLACLAGASGVLAQGPPDEPGSGILCWRDSVGFMVVVPEGWAAHPDIANKYGVCTILFPDGQLFHNASARIYPNVQAAQHASAEDNADVYAAFSAQSLAKRPGGEKVTVEKMPSIRSASGEHCEIRYFNNGPYPNVFEAIAYVEKDGVVLLAVLSAHSEEARKTALPALHSVLNNIETLTVILDKTP